MTHQVEVLVAISNDMQEFEADKILGEVVPSLTRLFGSIGQLRNTIVAARLNKEHVCAIVRFEDLAHADQVVERDISSLVLDVANASVRAVKKSEVKFLKRFFLSSKKSYV